MGSDKRRDQKHKTSSVQTCHVETGKTADIIDWVSISFVEDSPSGAATLLET